MNSIMIPRSIFDGISLGKKYYEERFPEDYSTMEDNPNYNSSGCGISVTAGDEEKTISIKDPNDNTKELCKMTYSNKKIKFIYPKPKMVDNVVNVGVGATEKLNILNANFEKLKSAVEESDLMKYVVRLNIDGCNFTVDNGFYNVDIDVTTVSD